MLAEYHSCHFITNEGLVLCFVVLFLHISVQFECVWSGASFLASTPGGVKLTWLWPSFFPLKVWVFFQALAKWLHIQITRQSRWAWNVELFRNGSISLSPRDFPNFFKFKIFLLRSLLSSLSPWTVRSIGQSNECWQFFTYFQVIKHVFCSIIPLCKMNKSKKLLKAQNYPWRVHMNFCLQL